MKIQAKKWVMLAAGVAMLARGAAAQSGAGSKALTIDVAQTIGNEALAACREQGFKVTVMVVDGANFPKFLARDDGASPASVELARMKAYTVIMNGGRPSGPPANLPPGAPVPAALLPGMTNFAGGVPIKAGDELIGVVAVSGASTPEKDAACANAGLAKVAERLK